MKRKILKAMYFFVCILIILTKECYGYLDPSAMTYMIQVTAAIIITISTTIGVLFYKFKRKFFKKEKKEFDNKVVEEAEITNGEEK